MKEIDLGSWPRRAHFEVFQGMDSGRYDCTVSLDVTETVEWCRTHKKSFYQTMIYQVVMATQVKKPDAGHPRATWGKFQLRHSRLQMPFNLEVHHALVDGAHVEMFVEALQEALAAPEKIA